MSGNHINAEFDAAHDQWSRSQQAAILMAIKAIEEGWSFDRIDKELYPVLQAALRKS